MVKIVVNHNRQEITYSYTLGQTFPNVEGKLLRVEVSGKELDALMEKKTIPVCMSNCPCITWSEGQAGGILKILREIAAGEVK